MKSAIAGTFAVMPLSMPAGAKSIDNEATVNGIPLRGEYKPVKDRVKMKLQTPPKCPVLQTKKMNVADAGPAEKCTPGNGYLN